MKYRFIIITLTLMALAAEITLVQTLTKEQAMLERAKTDSLTKAGYAEDWEAPRAWSWGLSKALDFFQTAKSVNPKQIGIERHSRRGKTTLLAAMNTRWVVVYTSCSGSGGASLGKRTFRENLGVIAGESEYHRMSPNFGKYGGNWKSLPVDAHDLMALIAPRPLFVTGGTQDLWANALAEFKDCVAGTPVYTVLGKKGVATSEMLAPDVSLIKAT